MLYGLVYSIFPILLIIGIVYLVFRARQGPQKNITSHQALIGYFYSVTAASVVIATVGLVYFMKIAISHAYTSGGIEEDVILGTVMLTLGVLLCAAHIYGRRAFERARKESSLKARKAYHIFMLALSGLTGLITLPMAIYSAISYHFRGSYYYGDPSTELALAVVIVPIWAYYLYMVIKEARVNETEEDSDSVIKS